MKIFEKILKKKSDDKPVVLQKELNKSIGFSYKFRLKIQKELDKLNKDNKG